MRGGGGGLELHSQLSGDFANLLSQLSIKTQRFAAASYLLYWFNALKADNKARFCLYCLSKHFFFSQPLTEHTQISNWVKKIT